MNDEKEEEVKEEEVKEEEVKVEDVEECPICMENPVNCYTDCKHGYCSLCLPKINKCALCRTPIRRYQQPQQQQNFNPYSFTLRPGDHQPSGSANFSRIDNAMLQLTLETSENTNSDSVRVYPINYNVLRVMSGMSGIAFSN